MAEVKSSSVIIVDGDGQVAGRLSSKVAKLLLEGHRVYVVNAEKVLISGKRHAVLNEWLKRREISSVVHPKHGPFHPKTPDGILTRMIRGMIPRRKPKGIDAMKRLRVYVGMPEHCRSMKKLVFEDAKATKPVSYYVALGELASALGWRGSPP